MNKRLKEVRKSKEVNLSQREFGRRLGVQDTAISKLESGERNLTDQMILAICREFNVNEEWLRTGEGGEEAMFEEYDDTNIAAVASEFNLDEFSKIILTAYVDMNAKKRAALNDFVKEMADSVMRENIEKARIGVDNIILNSRAPEIVKSDLTGKAAILFREAFPYIGSGEIDESEVHAADSEEQEKSALHAKLDEELAKEKKQDSKVSFAKESDAG